MSIPLIKWQLLRGKLHFHIYMVWKDFRAKIVFFNIFKKKKTLHILCHGWRMGAMVRWDVLLFFAPKSILLKVTHLLKCQKKWFFSFFRDVCEGAWKVQLKKMRLKWNTFWKEFTQNSKNNLIMMPKSLGLLELKCIRGTKYVSIIFRRKINEWKSNLSFTRTKMHPWHKICKSRKMEIGKC